MTTIKVKSDMSVKEDFIPPAEVAIATIEVSTTTAITMTTITIKIILLSILTIQTMHQYMK